MVYVFGNQFLLIGCEGVGDGIEQDGDGDIAALRQVVMLDRAEGGLDIVQFGRVGGQEIEVHAAPPKVGEGGAGLFAAMDGAVVEHDDGGERHRRQFLEEGDQMVSAQAARLGDPIEGGRGPAFDQGGERVDPPSFRILVGDALPLALLDPGVAHRLAGAEAALVEVDKPDAAGGGLFLSEPSTAFARSTLVGSCLWRSVRTVRRQAAMRPRYLRVWRGLSAMPNSASSAAASWAAVQVRSRSSKVSSTASTCARRAVSGGGPGGRRRSPATPVWGKRRSSRRTVTGLYRRWVAIAGAPQPASAKHTISTRSRSAGLRLGSRRSACTAVRSSVVSRSRSIHRIVPHPGTSA